MDEKIIKTLTRPECRTRLAGVQVGRLIHAPRALPPVCPLPFVMYDEVDLVLALSRKLRPALASLIGSVVVFHAGTISGPSPWHGWSITVTGVLNRWQTQSNGQSNGQFDGYLTISGDLVTGFEVVSGGSG